MRYGYPNAAGDRLLVIQSAASYAATDDSVKGRWVQVPDDAVEGATLVDGAWVNPPPVEPTLRFVVDVPSFLMRFTLAELGGVHAAAAADPKVAALMQVLNTAKAVNLQHPFVIDAVEYLPTADPPLLGPGRAAEILAGEPL